MASLTISSRSEALKDECKLDDRKCDRSLERTSSCRCRTPMRHTKANITTVSHESDGVAEPKLMDRHVSPQRSHCVLDNCDAVCN